MGDTQFLSDKLVLRNNHVFVSVAGEMRTHAVTWLARLSMSDGVRENQIPTGQVERLAWTKQWTFEMGKDAGRTARGWMQDEESIVNVPRGAAVRRSKSHVVQLQLGKHLATPEVKVFDREFTFGLPRQGRWCGLFNLRSDKM